MTAAPAEALLAALPLAAVAVKRRYEQGLRPLPSALAWALQNVTIVTPAEGRIPFAPYRYQREFLDDASPRRVVLKARQVGMSNALAIEALYRATMRRDQMILMVSRTGHLAQQLITYCQNTLVGLRDIPSVARENLSELAFSNGSRIVSLGAGPSAGRGFPASDVYLDEFAFIEYAELIYAAILPTLGRQGRMTILSTPNGRSNAFFRLWSGLEGGDWSRHSIHWSDCSRYDEDWAARTRAEMTRQSFAQEYDLDFIHSGDAVFEPDDLVRARAAHVADPAGIDEYVTAWDIGRRQDHTVGITLGRSGDVWHELAYERMLVPYPVVQASIEDRHRRFGGRTFVESNGVGDPVIENLSVRVSPFTTTTKTKTQAIQSLQLLLQQGRLTYASDQLDRELGLYSWDDRDLIQDSVMAAAIAAFQIVQPQRAVYVY